MNKWIAEFDLEDGDIMPEHMELNFKGAKIDFYCRPKESVLDKIRAEIQNGIHHFLDGEPIIEIKEVLQILDKYRAESEE